MDSSPRAEQSWFRKTLALFLNNFLGWQRGRILFSSFRNRPLDDAHPDLLVIFPRSDQNNDFDGGRSPSSSWESIRPCATTCLCRSHIHPWSFDASDWCGNVSSDGCEI